MSSESTDRKTYEERQRLAHDILDKLVMAHVTKETESVQPSQDEGGWYESKEDEDELVGKGAGVRVLSVDDDTSDDALGADVESTPHPEDEDSFSKEYYPFVNAVQAMRKVILATPEEREKEYETQMKTIRPNLHLLRGHLSSVANTLVNVFFAILCLPVTILQSIAHLIAKKGFNSDFFKPSWYEQRGGHNAFIMVGFEQKVERQFAEIMLELRKSDDKVSAAALGGNDSLFRSSSDADFDKICGDDQLGVGPHTLGSGGGNAQH